MADEADQPWTRHTPWRQGQVLPPDSVVYLGLAEADRVEGIRVVVISHDCDLANDNLDVEPNVEVLVGSLVAEEDGNCTWGKNPRTLHLPVQRGEGVEHFELVQTARCQVPKPALAKFLPSSEHEMGQQGLATLRSWLATRYNRAAFAEAFVARFRAAGAEQRLVKSLKSSGDLISFVFFRIEGGHTLERADGDPYKFDIVLVHTPGDDADASAESAEKLAAKVEADIQARLQDPTSMVLKSCFPLSEDAITVGEARMFTPWRLEHMTLKADEPQPGPPAV